MRGLSSAFAILVCLASPAWAVTVPLEAIPVTGGSRPRWRDVAENGYAAAFRNAFDYADATATLTYEPEDDTFVGRFVADGLKPHFAYQLKFVAAHDSAGMEPLGTLGRWWWEGGPLNVSDAQYFANRGNPAISSFLVFDYAVSDGDGHLEHDIRIDSTYHVLWRTGVNAVGVRSPRPEDGFSVETLVDPAVEPGGAYGVDYGPETVWVYGEHEHTGGNIRPLPGDLVFPDGDYELGFLITEESFHSYDALGGWWMHAFQSPADEPIRFTIAAERVPEPATIALLALGILTVRRRL